MFSVAPVLVQILDARLLACTLLGPARSIQAMSVADRAVQPGMQLTRLSSLPWREPGRGEQAGHRVGCP